MSFIPSRCPYEACASHRGVAFRRQRKGYFTRRCDNRRVPRFRCLVCKRSFSNQTFRLDFRLKRPELHQQLFPLFVSKVTHRQAARLLGCSRKSVHHRLKLLAEHACELQRELLARHVKEHGGLAGCFQLDELETFEHSRKLCPVTMPVLIETKSYFVIGVAVGTLPCRGRLTPKEKERKLAREKVEGRRKNESRAAVASCFERLKALIPAGKQTVVATDHKPLYGAILRQQLGARVIHSKHSSTAPRTYHNPLFPINHTLATLRDGLSRLVRRNWAASKKRQWLERHAWVWILYRNFVRYITNDAQDTSSAMALGVASRMLDAHDLLTWRVAAGAI
jgi:transposase-like protein